MLPSILARELQDSVRRFLRATFPMTTPLFRREAGGTLLEDFLARTDMVGQTAVQQVRCMKFAERFFLHASH